MTKPTLSWTSRPAIQMTRSPPCMHGSYMPMQLLWKDLRPMLLSYLQFPKLSRNKRNLISLRNRLAEQRCQAPVPAETCSRADQVGDDQLGIRDRIGRKRRAVPLRDLCAESLGSLTDGEGKGFLLLNLS